MWKCLVVSVVVGCGTPANHPLWEGVLDAGPIVETDCNVLTQTGCNTGEKCGWFHDSETPAPLGHIGCAADGMAAIGSACTFGPDGPAGFSNCARGSECLNGSCAQICDLDQGHPHCASGFSCSHVGLFDSAGPDVAGLCEPSCDPLADNYFGSGGDGFPPKTGSACASDQGCYGAPGTSQPTTAACFPAGDSTLVQGSTCATGCEDANTSIYACAPGYIPLVDDSTGSSQADCIAYCAPLDCWNDGGKVTCARTAAQTPTGVADGEALRGAYPHDCSNRSARGVFDLAVAGANNGVQCFYSWGFEVDDNGDHIASPTSDTLGYCIDHSKYRYDSNGDGMITAADAVWPSCDTLGIGSNQFDAAYFGCVSTTTAAAHGHPPAHLRHRDLPRVPYQKM